MVYYRAGSPQKRTYTWYINGDISVGSEQGAVYRLLHPCYASFLQLHVKGAPTGQSLIVDIKDLGVSLFSTLPEIDAGTNIENGNEVFSSRNLAFGNTITMAVTQVGSVNPGTDLTVSLEVLEKLEV